MHHACEARAVECTPWVSNYEYVKLIGFQIRLVQSDAVILNGRTARWWPPLRGSLTASERHARQSLAIQRGTTKKKFVKQIEKPVCLGFIRSQLTSPGELMP